MEDELQDQADVRAALPPGKPFYFSSFFFDSGLATALQIALNEGLDDASKAHLACVSREWSVTMRHPFFWQTLRMPPSVLGSVKDTTAFLDRHAARFYGVKEFNWPPGIALSGMGTLRHLVQKICPRLKAVDLSGLPRHYHVEGFWQAQLPVYLSAFTGSGVETIRLFASRSPTEHFGVRHFNRIPIESFLPGAEQAGLDLFAVGAPFALEVRKNADNVVESIRMQHVEYDDHHLDIRAPCWDFPELTTLELQFLPVARYSVPDGHFGYLYEGGFFANMNTVAGVLSPAETLATIVKFTPKLTSFVLRDAYAPEHYLELDVAGVRGGHLPATYPIPEYTEYLRQRAARGIRWDA